MSASDGDVLVANGQHGPVHFCSQLQWMAECTTYSEVYNYSWISSHFPVPHAFKRFCSSTTYQQARREVPPHSSLDLTRPCNICRTFCGSPEVLQEEILLQFGPPRTIDADNAKAFIAGAVVDLMIKKGIRWRTLLEYAPMRNGRAERMVGTSKRAIAKIVLNGGPGSVEAIVKVVSDYRCRKLAERHSAHELLHVVARV